MILISKNHIRANLPHLGSEGMARRDLTIAIFSWLIMAIGYNSVENVPMRFDFILKFIVYASCYAMLLSWIRMRQRAKRIDPKGREGYIEVLKFSVFYVSILFVSELPGIIYTLSTRGLM